MGITEEPGAGEEAEGKAMLRMDAAVSPEREQGKAG